MIRAHITDAEVMAAVRPGELSAYLYATGWRLTERTDNVAYWLWGHAGDEVEIAQPCNVAFRDYALRVGDAVVTLAAVENRSELAVLRGISQSTWDVYEYRPVPAGPMVPIDDGIAAYESLRALVAAAAYPVCAERDVPVQPTRRPQSVTDFLREVRLGPAGDGWFAVAAQVPVPPCWDGRRRSAPDGRRRDEPLGRRVSLRLDEAVRAATEAADSALVNRDGPDVFAAAVAQGVSANLCEALHGLGGPGTNSYELAVSLGAGRAGPALAPIRVRSDQLAVLKEAAAQLRAHVPEQGVTLTGEVVRLRRVDDTGGEITVVGRVEDGEPLRRIWIGLNDVDYGAAVRAHRDMRPVSVRGNLLRRGDRYHLTEPAGFRVEPG
jgi:hypothetical protein